MSAQRIIESHHDGNRVRSLECRCQKFGRSFWIRTKLDMGSRFSRLALTIRSVVLRTLPVSVHNQLKTCTAQDPDNQGKPRAFVAANRKAFNVPRQRPSPAWIRWATCVDRSFIGRSREASFSLVGAAEFGGHTAELWDGGWMFQPSANFSQRPEHQ